MTDWDDGRPEAEQRTSLGRLVEQLSEQTSRLVRTEVEIAKAELTDKAKAGGVGTGLLVGAAIFALFGLGYLIFTGYQGLVNVVSPWLAALIVGVALLVLAGLLALLGKNSLTKSVPQTQEAVGRIKQDVAAFKPQGKE